MKIRIYTLCMFVVLILPVYSSVIMTGIMDGTLGGGTPKAIELFVTGTENLSNYYLERSTNGGTFGSSTQLSGIYTNTFVYLIGTASGGVSQFQAVFGNSGIFANQLPCSIVNGNGDDAFRIVKISSGEVIDQVWYENYTLVYSDSYLYRIHGSGPDSGWIEGNWLIPGNDILDGLLPQAMANAVPFGSYSVVWDGSLSVNWHEGANWSSGQEPSETTNILIKPAAVMPEVNNDPSDPAVCRKLFIQSQSTLVVNSGKALTVYGNVMIQSSPGSNPTFLALKSPMDSGPGGSLLVKGQVIGLIYVERGISKNWDWHFLASPVSSQAIQPEFAPSPIDTTFDMYYWDPTAEIEEGWINIRDDQGNLNPDFETSFHQGKGYLLSYGPMNSGEDIREFFGQVSFTDRSIPVIGGGAGNGWNLLGNPYPCALDWTSEGLDRSLITGGAMYIWDQDLNGGAGGYRIHDGIIGIPSGTTPIIPPIQGFFVHATNTGAFGINADSSDALVHTTQGYYKDDPTDVLRVHINRQGLTDETVIHINPNSTNGFDQNYDSYKLFRNHPEIPEISSVSDSSNLLCINSIRDIPATLPLLVRSSVSTGIVLNASGLETLDPEIQVLLEDKYSGQFINLRENSSYAMNIQQGDNSDRLFIHLESTTSLNEEIIPEDAIWTYNRILYMPEGMESSTIIIYSITGQLLKTIANNSSTQTEILLNLKPGCYIIVIHQSGGVKAKKLIIQ